MNSTLIQGFLNRFRGPFWEHWPFGPGYGDLLASVTRFLLAAAIMLFIILYLRLLFGPKGWFRDKELDREAAEEKEAAQARLKRLLDAGELTEAEYALRLKHLE